MNAPAEPTLAGFFGGGGKAAKFPTKGTTIKGTITAVHPPEQQTDFETRQPIPGKTQVRIELSTDLRDPDIDNDDGSRTLYVRGWMTGAIGQALRKAGVNEPQTGGTLSVTYSSDGPPSRPGLNGPKQYEAEYSPPSGDTATFFNNTTGNDTDSPPPGIDAAAWAAMPEETKAALRALPLKKSDDPPF